MKNIFTTLATLTMASIAAFGQTSTKKIAESLSRDYDRNSLSVIMITHGDSYDEAVLEGFNHVSFGDKYDINEIPTRTIRVNFPRTYNKEDYSAKSQYRDKINHVIYNSDLGQEVISYIYDRQSDGTMTNDRIIQRGHYNATDQDYLHAQTQKLGLAALGDQGFKLINNSYVMVLDLANITRKTNDENEEYYEGDLFYFVYRTEYTQEIQDQIFSTWIEEEDTPEIRQSKIDTYNNITIRLTGATNGILGKSEKTKNGGVSSMASTSFSSAIYEIEKAIAALQVKASVVTTRPITSKIGRKEGAKNGDLYFTYRYKLADDGHTAIPVRTGSVRATKIANNRHVAQGQTETSEFVQISGRRIDPGNTLKQHNDLGLGVMAGYKQGVISEFYVGIDYLSNIKTSGIAQYACFDFTAGGYNLQKLYSSNNLTQALGDPKKLTAFSAGIGYGVGYKFARNFEISASAKILVDYLRNGDKDNTDSDEKSKEFAYGLLPGARLSVNIFYPLALFAGVDYHLPLIEDDHYKAHLDLLKAINKERTGVTYTMGLKYTF